MIKSKIRGYRVETKEIESVIRCINGVQDAAVVAHVTASGQTELSAYVVTKPELSTNTVRSELQNKLPVFMHLRLLKNWMHFHCHLTASWIAEHFRNPYRRAELNVHSSRQPARWNKYWRIYGQKYWGQKKSELLIRSLNLRRFDQSVTSIRAASSDRKANGSKRFV
ncbi:hypothetical protein QO179_01145 [Bacillus stercoris]|nr:hypothetical protein [Bacillus stercoris]